MKRNTLTPTVALLSVVAFLALSVPDLSAQNKFKFYDKIEFRGDATYDVNSITGDGVFNALPREGIFEFRGTWGPHWEYRYRNRFVKWATGTDFWTASDVCYLGFYAGDHLRLRAGKGALNIGGFEYDQSPIDVMFISEFINGIQCYLPAADIDWIMENDRLGFEISRSPLMYGEGKGFNFIWEGHHGPLNTLWSINVFENEPHKYMEMVNLGTQGVWGPVTFHLDFLPRFHFEAPKDFFRDVTLTSRVTWTAADWVRLSAYAAYDHNSTGNAYDHIVMTGTSIANTSFLAEFFPTRSDNLRLHLCFTSRNGTLGTGIVGGVATSTPVHNNVFDFGVTIKHIRHHEW